MTLDKTSDTHDTLGLGPEFRYEGTNTVHVCFEVSNIQLGIFPSERRVFSGVDVLFDERPPCGSDHRVSSGRTAGYDYAAALEEDFCDGALKKDHAFRCTPSCSSWRSNNCIILV